MKPKIKQIEIEARHWGGKEKPSFLVCFGRWSHIAKNCRPQNARYSHYYNPTLASIARVRRAQESMVQR